VLLSRIIRTCGLLPQYATKRHAQGYPSIKHPLLIDLQGTEQELTEYSNVKKINVREDHTWSGGIGEPSHTPK